MLEHQHKQRKIHRLERIHQQDQEKAGDRANERPEKRDNVCHADDRCHQGWVGEAEDIAANQTNHADDCGIYQLAVDEAAHDAVRTADFLYHQVSVPGGEKAVDDFFGLSRKGILPGQQIHRHDQPDQNVLQNHQ